MPANKWSQVLPLELRQPAKLAAIGAGMTLEQWVAEAIRSALEDAAAPRRKAK